MMHFEFVFVYGVKQKVSVHVFLLMNFMHVQSIQVSDCLEIENVLHLF